MKKSNKQKEESFEDSIRRVETIATELEDGELTLQKRVDKFEEGIRLLKKCESELKNVELTIQKVIDKNERIEFENLE